MASYEYSKFCDLDGLAGEILAGMGYKVLASASNDSVNGYIEGCDDTTWITFYTANEDPNSLHDTTLVSTTLTSEEEDDLDTIVDDHTP